MTTFLQRLPQCHSEQFTDKKLPFADISADGIFLCYYVITTKHKRKEIGKLRTAFDSAVSELRNKTSIAKTELPKGIPFMRHAITRTIIGVIWFIAAIAGLFTANYMMTVIGLIAGFVYLNSVVSIRKKEKENK